MSADDIVLLFVGRIQPLKAPDILVRAAAHLLDRRPDLRPRLKVVINGGLSGNGLQRSAELPALVDALGLRDIVTMMPPVTRDRLADLYRAADVVVVPSYSESFGLVAVEAQACGIPVVASRVGGLTTAVGDGGVLVAGHDPARFADALDAIVGDQATQQRMSVLARRHAQRFSWAATATATLQAYDRALAGRPILLRRYA